MENLKEINWRERERELESFFSDRFRRIWLQHTRLGNICITAFPHGVANGYEIFTAFKINDWSVENLKNIVLSKIEK